MKISKRLNLPLKKDIIFWIILAGLFFRCSEYIANRSLWLDEAIVAEKVSEYSISELTNGRNPDKSLAYPAGFLVIEKFAAKFFNNNEYALRFYPFACGILSLFLFYHLSGSFFSRKYTTLALTLFAISPMAIYYSSEAKPYSSDILAALLLSWFFMSHHSKGRESINLKGFCLAVLLSAWLSHIAVFIVFGVGPLLFFHNVLTKKEKEASDLLLVLLIFSASLTIYYFTSLKTFAGDNNLTAFWQKISAFMPSNGSWLSYLKWTYSALALFLKIIFNYPPLFGCFVLAGIISMFIKDRTHCFILMAPIALTIAGAYFKIYPFQGRLVLFLLPSFIFLTIEGLKSLLPRKESLAKKALEILFLIILICPTLFVTIKQFNDPHGVEEIKPVMRQISQQKDNWDKVYVYSASAPAFKYYAKRYGFDNNHYIVGRSLKENQDSFSKDLDELREQNLHRVWFIFTHIDIDDGKSCFDELNKRGKRIGSYLTTITPGCPPGYYSKNFSAIGLLYEI